MNERFVPFNGSGKRKAQSEVIQGILRSRDRFTLLRGVADSGKISTLKELTRGLKGNPLLLAPTNSAVEVLKQDRNAPVDVELQIAIIYAVVNNLLKEVPIADISRFEKELFEYLTATKGELLAEIRTTGVLTAETEAALKEAIIYCRNQFLGKA